ncbi:hypothetical protein Poli38472_013884 [Pythium oligandrum]|uniref:N-acetyltransferase domain-containing protein n=1 Tax=Pythium oligandrum TaxID=41045 RepID=A0A8K1C2T9_PYTOL|nr:hypothetical protein Poli38472_013884 [Pythium oligandrum]|eukprot:TMW55122.1 hypothetical protein Poli38472_013884 [Pythium oligandrum]
MGREAEDGAPGTATGSGHEDTQQETTTRVKLRALLQEPTLVAQVKKLNLGILPVQCPALCYKRALNNDTLRLSCAAVLTARDVEDDGRKEGNGEQEEGSERKRRRVEHETSDDAVVVVGGLLAEHDPIHHLVHIQTLAVDAKHRRSGVGRLLVERVIEQARAAPSGAVKCVQLHVHEANEAAIAFYHRLGFNEYKRMDNYYRHLTPRTALVLRRELEFSQPIESNEERKENTEEKQALRSSLS